MVRRLLKFHFVFLAAGLLAGCESSPSAESVATTQLIGKWSGRLEIQKDALRDPSFPVKNPAVLKSGKTVFHFKYNHAGVIENQVGGLISKTLINWQVTDVDGDKVSIEIGTRDKPSESRPSGTIVLTFEDDDHFQLTRQFGNYASSYERVKSP